MFNMKLNRKLWIAVVSGVLVTASVAQGNLLTQEVNQDLFFSYLNSNKQDRFQKAFAALGVHNVPSMLTDDEQKQLRPAANILWNREYELLRLPKMIKNLEAQKPQDLEQIAKREKELKNQPALLEKAKNIYNKRVDDIAMERSATLIGKMPSTNPQVVRCSDIQSSDKKAVQADDSANSISSLANDTAKIVQQNVRDEQVKDEHSKDWVEASSKLPSTKDIVQGEAKLGSISAPLLGNQTASSGTVQSTPVHNVKPIRAAIPAPLSVPAFDFSSVSQESVSDSRFTLTGSSPKPNQGVLVVIHKEGEETTLPSGRQVMKVVSDANGHFEIPAYLEEGKGNYTVDVKFENFALQNSYDPAKVFKVSNQDSKDETYLLPTAAVQSDDSRIVSLSNQIVSDAGASTDFEKAKAINDWMSLNVTYDAQELARINSGEEKSWQKTAVDVLAGGPKPTGVCYGYSMLYAALSRAAGLPTKVIFGQSREGLHAWNEVEVDGTWKPVDTTWDMALFKNRVLIPGEQYFDISREDFQKDHQTSETETM